MTTITQGVGFTLDFFASAAATPPDGTPVGFQVLSGANTDRWAGSFLNGEAQTTRTEPLAGTDTIYAFYLDASDNEIDSNNVTVTWINDPFLTLVGAIPSPLEFAGGTSTYVQAGPGDTNLQPAAAGTPVSIAVLSGPDTGRHWSAVTAGNGFADTPSFTDLTPGLDTFQATFTDKIGQVITSNKLTIQWDGTHQTITFAQPAAGQAGGPPVELLANASSGLAVSFTSGSPSACTILGSVALPVSPGTCSITAHQAGNPTTYPAPDVTQTFSVSPGATLRPGQTPLPVATAAPRAAAASGSSVPVGTSSGTGATGQPGPVVSSSATAQPGPATPQASVAASPVTATTDTGIPPWLVIVLIVMALVIGVLGTGLAISLRRGRS